MTVVNTIYVDARFWSVFRQINAIEIKNWHHVSSLLQEQLILWSNASILLESNRVGTWSTCHYVGSIVEVNKGIPFWTVKWLSKVSLPDNIYGRVCNNYHEIQKLQECLSLFFHRLKAHVEDATKFPMLIFPEGEHLQASLGHWVLSMTSRVSYLLHLGMV